MFRSALIIFLCVLSACTYTITLVHTQGTASDVVDDTSSPTATVSPNLNIPVKGITP